LALLRDRARKGSLSKLGINLEAMTVKEKEAALSAMLANDAMMWSNGWKTIRTTPFASL
jgi:hypothetical protein